MIYRLLSLSSILALAASDEAVTKPLPKPNTDKLFFYETFDEGDPFVSGKMFKSSDSKYLDQDLVITPSKTNPVGNGLQLKTEMKHYGFGAKFKAPLTLKGKKEIVVQYDLKLEDTLACGGAYIKLPRVTPDLNLDSFNSDTPYAIMFGPDKCGSSNNKVHFIYQHQNPLNQVWEEKHANETSTVKMDKKTHLYTLVLREDNSYEVFVDKKSSKKGSLLTHMKPSINPPKEVDDPEDFKPLDWVDEEKMDDPNAVKPADWDEDAPKKIPDPSAVKPEGWLDDEPLKIPDPKASKPEDWDDDEDGTWEAPLVKNPACSKVGCGEWKAPIISNPDYKGKWKVPTIVNPLYKGPWEAKKIPNKDFFVDNNPVSNMPPIAGLIVEVWTTNGGILFDNFAVSHSLEDSFKFADQTYGPKEEAENAKIKNNKDKKDKKDVKKNKNEKDEVRNVEINDIPSLIEFIKTYSEANPWAIVSCFLALLLSFLLLNSSYDKSRPSSIPVSKSLPIKSSSTAATEVKSDEYFKEYEDLINKKE